ncbi:hypothetical protein DESPIG_00043 [Desulfovibrio piger ATCC 29098]|uniref:Uncharacterized protein n=1 Tax=Desulfovibrio piger ATCC 29098 TaxID=411464 RepID=B6WPS8_9BACT|nr:hypothetical protein DESPIG_00043 [Desulfovibrio piger ATCC 29098]
MRPTGPRSSSFHCPRKKSFILPCCPSLSGWSQQIRPQGIFFFSNGLKDATQAQRVALTPL